MNLHDCNIPLDTAASLAPAVRSSSRFLFQEANFHPTVRCEDFKRFLRYPPRRAFDTPLAENASWAQSWFAAHARPWFCTLVVDTQAQPGRGLRIDDEWFDSPALAEKFANIDRAVIAIASASAEADLEAAARWQAGEPDRYFFLESYSAAVANALLWELRQRLRTWTGGRALFPHHGPGYAGWSIADTPRLLAHVAAASDLPGPIEALGSGMLRPKKSHLVLFGLESTCTPFGR